MTEAVAGGPIAWGTGRGRWVIAATVAGSGMAFLDGTVVNVALPTIGEDMGADLAGLQWVLNGYMLTLASLILLSGSLGDRFGRRRIFLIGVIWFAVASALCAAAPTVVVLIIARALQGVGAALLTPGSLALLESEFRTADRARAIGTWSGLTGVANAVGPFLGGWLVDVGSWRFIFLLNLPLAAFVILVTVRHVPESRDAEPSGRLDYLGAALTVVGLGGTTYGLTEAGQRGFAAPVVWVALLIGVGGLAGFVIRILRARSPLIPPALFRVRQFTAANLVTATVYAALGSVFFLLVVFLQTALGYTALEAGIASLPITILMLTLSGTSGHLAEKLGPRLQMSAGPLVMAVGVLLLLRVSPGDAYFTSVLPAILVLGLGLASTVAPLTATALGAADERHAGIASGVNNAVARAAQLTAVAVVPLAAGLSGDAYRQPAAFTGGFHTAMLITACVVGAGGLLALATIRNQVHAKPEAAPPPVTYHCAMDGTPLTGCPRAAQDPDDRAA
ncbi:MAG TPA: DHA2 family efflux MFS transporter permease subunit [Streptosporangiaceae bacterium]|jgi:EmrB/QacA subfamily drug resistance transporter